MGVEIQGIDGLIERFDDIADGSDLKMVVGKACALVEATAKQKAPKDTGALRRSIESKVDTLGTEVIGTIFTPLEYAPYIEYGTGLLAEERGRMTRWSYQDDEGNWHTTRGARPHPFMRPALYENREEIVRILKGGME